MQSDSYSGFDLAVVGLGVMGTSFSLNLNQKGYSVATYDLSPQAIQKFNQSHKSKVLFATDNLRELVSSLSRPRKIILLISPGAPIDNCLDALIPMLEEQDIILDFGNSHFKDTERRQSRCSEKSIHFVGVGISGGREGALNGPSLMPSGENDALQQVLPILEKVAANSDGKACVAAIGPQGSGHFVKTIHNGIEYGLMQAIAETYDIFRACGFQAKEIADIFEDWSKGKLGSFLMEVSFNCLKKIDKETSKSLVDLISDVAEQKGTGKWTIIEALNLGVPCAALAAALEARNVSANTKDRNSLALFRENSGQKTFDRNHLIDICQKSLQFAYLVCYSQGFSILQAASTSYNWNLNLAEISFIWRAGCIIRSNLLEDIQEALSITGETQLLLGKTKLHDTVDKDTKALREVLALAMTWQIPTPVMSACLSYFDSLKAEKLPQNLVQAQRDFFGSHKFKRIDKEGYFSSEW